MLLSIFAGLGIGLLGSFHCIGMCGPIALSLPVYGKSQIEKIFLIVLYNLGRATTYAAFGILFGYIGTRFSVFGYQQIFSVIVGLLILFSVFFGRIFVMRFTFFQGLLQKLKYHLAKLLQSEKQVYSYFFIGFLNGLLPCGLVYIAIASAMVLGNVFASATFMFMFGLGTFPLMMSIMIFGKFISISIRKKIQKLIPVFVVFTGCMLILRGANLGIPYLSPQAPVNSSELMQIKCHK